jgi:hypothetical protein
MGTQDVGVEVADCGIDWLSFTVPHGSEALEPLRAAWDAKMDAEVLEFGEALKTAPQGYHGYKTRHWFRGERHDGSYFQATSSPAREAAECVKRTAGAVAVTRCDYQITCREPSRAKGNFARYRDECRAREGREGATARRSTALFESDIRGDSVTLNSASSKRVLTIYDKSAESRGALGEDLTRYELRTRHQQARATFAQFREADNQARFSASLVSDMMRRVGFPVVWPDVDGSVCLPSSYEKSDEERRIKWLLETVLPTCSKIESAEARRMLRAKFNIALLV